MLQNKNVKDNVNNEPYFTHKSKIAILKNHKKLRREPMVN